eukprot:gene27259-30088_t
MNDIIGRVLSFEKGVFPDQSALYAKLAQHGQSPKALMISCADSRVVPEHIMQAAPGDLFVCRNAGNIVPPSSSQMGGVSSTVEYAVSALGVRDIIICGHSDCGAMKALMNPEMLNGMPNVAAWLRHSHAAECVVRQGYPELTNEEGVRAAALENVVVQLQHLPPIRVSIGVATGACPVDVVLLSGNSIYRVVDQSTTLLSCSPEAGGGTAGLQLLSGLGACGQRADGGGNDIVEAAQQVMLFVDHGLGLG